MQVLAGFGVATVVAEWRGQLRDLRRTWRDDARARRWVGLALGAGALVILLAVAVDLARYFDLHHYRARFLSLTKDRGLPELVMDALALTAVVALWLLYLRAGLRGFLFFAVLLLVVILDDLLRVHETVGPFLVARLHVGGWGGVTSEAVGELVFLAGVGACLLPFLAWCLWPLRPENLAVLVTYGLIFSVFVLFAGGVDALHSMVEGSVMDRLMGWIEDGGEILSISILTAVALLQLRGKRFS